MGANTFLLGNFDHVLVDDLGAGLFLQVVVETFTLSFRLLLVLVPIKVSAVESTEISGFGLMAYCLAVQGAPHRVPVPVVAAADACLGPELPLAEVDYEILLPSLSLRCPAPLLSLVLLFFDLPDYVQGHLVVGSFGLGHQLGGLDCARGCRL